VIVHPLSTGNICKILTKYPDYPPVNFNIGLIEEYGGKLKEAIEHYKKQVRILKKQKNELKNLIKNLKTKNG